MLLWRFCCNMKIRNYTRGDAAEVLRLWNTAGAQTMGYAPQSAEGLDALLLRHPDFSEKHSFVLTDADGVRGFVSGVTGDALAQGRVRGYFSDVYKRQAALKRRRGQYVCGGKTSVSPCRQGLR